MGSSNQFRLHLGPDDPDGGLALPDPSRLMTEAMGWHSQGIKPLS